MGESGWLTKAEGGTNVETAGFSTSSVPIKNSLSFGTKRFGCSVLGCGSKLDDSSGDAIPISLSVEVNWIGAGTESYELAIRTAFDSILGAGAFGVSLKLGAGGFPANLKLGAGGFALDD